MSKTVYANVSNFSTSRPIPVQEPKVKTGSGKATYKTASAAANAAREARDEARDEATKCEIMRIACENSKQLCLMTAESMHKLYKRDMVWKMLILLGLVAEVATRFII